MQFVQYIVGLSVKDSWMENKPNIVGTILLAILAVIGIAWKTEGVLLNRKILRNRAKRTEVWWR
jgi:uncharacterized membrane protein YbjE (DUF340 family)